jgi:hypothetical protein
MTAVMFLVLAIMSSTTPSLCQAGNCKVFTFTYPALTFVMFTCKESCFICVVLHTCMFIGLGCKRTPPPPSDETCYEDRKCSASRCHLGCIHRGFVGNDRGAYCRGNDCCCKHWCTVMHLYAFHDNSIKAVSFATDYKWNTTKVQLMIETFWDATFKL